MSDIQELSEEEAFLSMLAAESRLPQFELASIAHDALYAISERGEDIPTVQLLYQKAIERYLRNHMWD